MLRYGSYEMRLSDDTDTWELVKWYPASEKELCYVISFFSWDKKNSEWTMRPIGYRYLTDTYTKINEYVLACLEVMTICKEKEEEDNADGCRY